MMIFTNLREAPPVDQQAIMRPLAWRIVQTTNGNCYLAAKMPNGGLRMTSAFNSTNPVDRVAITDSRRAYQLDEGPTTDGATITMLMAVVSFALRSGYEDISLQVWDFMLRATH